MAARSPYVCSLCGAPCRYETAFATSAFCSQQPVTQQQHLQSNSSGSSNCKKSQKRPCVCGGCGAMHYCCEAHRNRHALLPGGHCREECGRMASQVARAAELADLPFPWFRSLMSIWASFPDRYDKPDDGTAPPRSAVPAAAAVAAAASPPPLSLCVLLNRLQDGQSTAAAGGGAGASGGAQGPASEGAGGAAAGKAAVEGPHGGGGGGSGAGSSTGGGGSGCTAPGCWRRICGCAEGGLPQGCGAVHEDDWGALQPPLLAKAWLPPAAASVAAPRDADADASTSAAAAASGGAHAAWAARMWHLPPHLVPPLRVPQGGRPDDGDVETGGVAVASIVDWLSYYRWAGLPLESPAALLLHFPMTLYGTLRRLDERLAGGLLRRPGLAAATAEAVAASAAAAAAATSPGRGPAVAREEGGEREAGHCPPAKRRCLGDRGPLVLAAAAEEAEAAQRDRGSLPGGVCSQSAQAAPVTREEEGAERRRGGGGGAGRGEHVGAAAAAWLEAAAETAAAAEQEEGAGRRRRVDVLYLGPQSELDQLDSFACLLPLLPPGLALRLHMVGPDVPAHLHGAVLTYDGADVLRAGGGAAAAAGKPVSGGGSGGGGDKGAGAGAADAAEGVQVGLGGGGGLPRKGPPPPPHPPPPPPRLEISLHSCLLHDPEAEGLLLEEEEEAPLEGGAVGFTPACGADGGGGGDGGGGSGGGGGGDARRPHERQQQRRPAAAAATGATAGKVPLLVFAPNAGLPVYMSWLPSLELLVMRMMGRQQEQQGHGQQQEQQDKEQQEPQGQEEGAAAEVTTDARAAAVDAAAPEGRSCCSRRRCRPRVPLACVFTAYNEEECVRSCELLERLYGVRPNVRPAVNPFRQPLWCVSRVGNGLPSYSNGFMYGWLAEG